MAKKTSTKKALKEAESKVAALQVAEQSYLANLELCRAAIENPELERLAIGQAVKLFELQVQGVLKEGV